MNDTLSEVKRIIGKFAKNKEALESATTTTHIQKDLGVSSMNLVDVEATPIHRVLDLVRSEAARYGAAVSGCEVVGLVPQSALLAAAEHALQLEGFRRDQVLELRLENPPVSGGMRLSSFLEQVASPSPTSRSACRRRWPTSSAARCRPSWSATGWSSAPRSPGTPGAG